MNKSITNILRTDILLFIEFLIISAYILFHSFFYADGFITPDSSNYLSLANNLLNGNGFWVQGFGYSGNEKDYFSIWPAGYPLLIAAIAKVTSLNVFWSSKVLNILLAAGSLLLLRNTFAKTAHIYGLLFFTGAAIVIFSSTWSETLFIFALIGFSSSLTKAITLDTLKKNHLIALIAFMLLLFISRYIGAFCITIIGGLGVYYLLQKSHRKKGLAFIFAATIASLCVLLYLYTNYNNTGYLTGRPRIPAPESNIEFLIQLIFGLFAELILPLPVIPLRPEILLIIIIQLAIYYRFLKEYISTKTTLQNTISITHCGFFITGTTYFFCIIMVRYFTQFDEFTFRILFPGSLLILISLLKHLELKKMHLFLTLSKVLYLLSALTLLLTFAIFFLSPKQPTYQDNITLIKNNYSIIPKNSVVAFGNMHIKYIRDDIFLWDPMSLPYETQQETWNEFISRVGNNKTIYIDTFKKSTLKTYDESIYQLLNKHKENALILRHSPNQ